MTNEYGRIRHAFSQIIYADPSASVRLGKLLPQGKTERPGADRTSRRRPTRSLLIQGMCHSGTLEWTLNVAKSDLGSAPIDALVVEVEHKEPIFKYVAKGMAAGQPFEEQEALTTDGKPGQDARGATVVTRWEGDSLVTQATSGDGSPLYESRLSLGTDGKTITRLFVLVTADGSRIRREMYERQNVAGEI
jgi:hypothetical protein